MWIRNEYGHLLNLRHAHVVRLVTAHGEHYVQARFGSTESDFADVTKARTEPEAKAVMDTIVAAMVRGDEFFDLAGLSLGES